MRHLSKLERRKVTKSQRAPLFKKMSVCFSGCGSGYDYILINLT